MNFEKTLDSIPADSETGLTILIVDDEELGRLRSESACKRLGNDYRVLLASSVNEALTVLSSTQVHVVLLDKNIGPNEEDPNQNGIEAIPEMLKIRPHLQVLVITGSRDYQDAVTATQYGAFGYITKECPESLLLANIQKAVQMASLLLHKERLERATLVSADINLVGSSRAITRLKSEIADVAQSDRPILLIGETGTGKTTIAKLIHESRKLFLKQKDRPFVSVNIAALSPTLVEGELFGSEKGSYTGSVASKPGLFELANSGTLFLDEIGEISSEIQKKLLTVIETGVFRRVGGTKELKSSFRLVCATNRNLEEMVSHGLFREDLYLRLSTFPIRVPSLSERSEDISEIIRSLIPRCCQENRVQVSFEDIPKDYIEYLKRNIPNGNIRGLEQQLSRLLIHSPKNRSGKPILKKWKSIGAHIASIEKPGTAISYDELMLRPFDFVGSPKFPGLSSFIEQLESRILIEAKNRFKKNKDVAHILKVSEGTVSLRLAKLRMNIKERGAE